MNGQRPNSNNITIDGVANIDTGDNGGEHMTTNIDSVAEFKILTNAYQAEYGRAVCGQLQVVTKSGTQQYRGSGYWYGRRSGWDANTFLNKRNTPEIIPPKTSRNDSGYTFGGPVSFPGFNAEKKKLFFFFSQEYQRRTSPQHSPRVCRLLSSARVTSRERRQQRQSAPVHPRRFDRAAQSAADTRGCFRTAASSGSPRAGSTRPSRR